LTVYGAEYGLESQYRMDWDAVDDVLETGGSRYGSSSGSGYNPRYGESTDNSTGYEGFGDADRDRYAPGRSYDPITGYGFLELPSPYGDY
jgi:hypothetical protein